MEPTIPHDVYPPLIPITSENIPVLLEVTRAAVQTKYPTVQPERIGKYLDYILPALERLARSGEMNPEQLLVLETKAYAQYAAVNIFKSLIEGRAVARDSMCTQISVNCVSPRAAANMQVKAEAPQPSPPADRPLLFNRLRTFSRRSEP